ncbi:MAG TPA: tripartite tricarboxylate transporter substrate binding protein, partial [Mycobacterium sp.]|nr:tripartite tricarboxylate transporter substrate binding protein [Mycobacterium sp.]
MRLKLALTAVATAAAVVLSGCGGGSSGGGSAENYPSETLNWTIAFGPGGGNDLMSRKLVQIIQDQKLYPADIAVENR